MFETAMETLKRSIYASAKKSLNPDLLEAAKENLDGCAARLRASKEECENPSLATDVIADMKKREAVKADIVNAAMQIDDLSVLEDIQRQMKDG